MARAANRKRRSEGTSAGKCGQNCGGSHPNSDFQATVQWHIQAFDTRALFAKAWFYQLAVASAHRHPL